LLKRKFFILTLIVLLLTSLVVGCSSGEVENLNSGGETNTGSNQTASKNEGSVKEEIVDIEVWKTTNGKKGIEKGSPLYDFYVDKLGVGVIHPYVDWNGGTGYLNQLNLKIAAGEMPDLFLPWGGIETDLAKNGAIADLTDLLPEYAPNLWKRVPQKVWDVVKANDPTGKGRIYYVPGFRDYGVQGGLIRKDWLDLLGLEMPTTQEEYVEVLKAFKTKDPNQNGLQDEIPTGGREDARWMDHLFAMYGIAMNEGFPDWDIYDGELTYSAVTPNMRDALQFISKLYAENLLDQETLLNNKKAWDGKINSGLVGNYFHFTWSVGNRLADIEKAFGVKGDISVLPLPKVPGYEGFYSYKPTLDPKWVVKNNQDEKKLMATLKLLNNYADESRWPDLYFGVEGMHHVVKDGKRVRLPDDYSTMQNDNVLIPYDDIGTLEYKSELLMDAASEDTMWFMEQNVRDLRDIQQHVKAIAGDGMPGSVYEDYPDIRSASLYVEYATKIIIGQYPIEKFDEFVERWNKSGGEEVTQKARNWYQNLGK